MHIHDVDNPNQNEAHGGNQARFQLAGDAH